MADIEKGGDETKKKQEEKAKTAAGEGTKEEAAGKTKEAGGDEKSPVARGVKLPMVPVPSSSV